MTRDLERWQQRWNDRLTAATTPRDRATVAWSLLLATLARAPVSQDNRDAVWNHIADQLVQLSTAAMNVPPSQSSAPRPRQFWDPSHPDYTGAP